MKDKIQSYLLSIAILLALTLLFSLAFACLYYFNVIGTTTFHTINWIGGLCAFGGGGIVLGLRIEKKALFNAFFISMVLLVLALLIGNHTLMGIIEIISKVLCYILLCLLAYTKRSKN